MNQQIAKTGVIAAAVALMLGLAACSKTDDNQTAGQKLDTAIAKTQEKAAEIKADVKDAAAETKADTKAAMADAKADTKSAMADVKADVKDATSDAKAKSADATSTIGEKIDDAAITTAVNAGLAKDSDLSAIKINVDTKNGAVTLMGPAPTSAAKSRATDIAKNVKGVTTVNNQLTVKG